MSLTLPDERHFKLPAQKFVWEMPLFRNSRYSILLWRTLGNCAHPTGAQSLEKICKWCIEENLLHCKEGEKVAGKGNSSGDCC